MTGPGWTTPDDVQAQVRRWWERGELLDGSAEFPRPLRLKKPTAKELGPRFGEVRAWLAELQEGAERLGFRIEWKTVEHRQLGRNDVPEALQVPDLETALRLARKTKDAARFRELTDAVGTAFPSLAAWTLRRPHVVLEHDVAWPRMLDVLRWFVAHPRPGVYRRQVDVPGVDTKFIEQRKGVLAELLEVVLPRAEGAPTAGQSFDERFGLTSKPVLVRFRLLDERLFLHGLSDLSVPLPDFARLSLPVQEVLVVENEVTGLALPPLAGTMVVFGQGYAAERLGQVPWLKDVRLRYWGDLDTHGFRILDAFRAVLPHANSVLMDRETLLAHRPHWTEEGEPCLARLEHLTAPEAQLYAELQRGTHGPRVRLEQERVGFGWAVSALG